uniref:BTB domain-containing protein n=1 Tax=Panagrellus redivivus TaxID=6233 RepID=A0A7E4VS01_PANRE
MTMATATPLHRFVEQVGALYRKDKLSDVTIVIGDVEIPAHRVILAQRCKHFEVMFGQGAVDANSRIELLNTPIDGFNAVLKWIYTSSIELISVENASEVIRVAQMLHIEELVDLVIEWFKQNCRVETVCFILNEAVRLSLNGLTTFAIQCLRNPPCEVLKHATFAALSPEALNKVLVECILEAPYSDIFRAVLNWMRANPAKRDNFPDIMKNVPLSSITLQDVAAVPADVIDPQVIVDLVREQQVAGGPLYVLKYENLALYGSNVTIDGKTALFQPAYVSAHRIDAEGILIDLGRRFMLNLLRMVVLGSYGSYMISVSEDNVSWTQVINHSKYKCRGNQTLYFKARPVRYIRIQGTASPDPLFSISHFEAYHTVRPFF